MQTVTNQSGQLPDLSAKHQTQTLTPLALETRSVIPTEAAALHLNRKTQTLRAWACFDNGPIRPIRINGRLAWPVEEIKALLKTA